MNARTMTKQRILSGISGPTTLVSVMLFALCVVSAVTIYQQQQTTAYFLEENLDSRRAAHDLETALGDLLAQLRKGSHEVEGLHDRIHEQLGRVTELADKDEEKRFVAKLQELYENGQSEWKRLLAGDDAANRQLQVTA